MHASVQFLYREGVYVRGNIPVVGQIFSDRRKDVPVLYLRSLEWTENQGTAAEPLAILWHPVVVNVRYDSMCFRGLEATPRGPTRRWSTQKWLVDILDAQRARTRAGGNR